MAVFKSSTVNSAIIGIYILLLTVFVIVALYYGKPILVPLAIGILLTFLLAPLVTLLERWIWRIPAILITVLLIFFIVSMIGYILTKEFINLTSNIPTYKENIQAKIQALQFPKEGKLSKAWTFFQDIRDNLPLNNVASGDETQLPKVPASKTIKVEVVQTSALAANAGIFFGLFFDFLVAVALALLLTVFILLNREDLYGRVVRLAGQGRIGATTEAFDDAAIRISRYLYMQLMLNISFGFIVGVGLYLIGIPNALLWGFLSAILRFLPYVGPWISALFPIILSFLISTDWTTPLMTISLYVILELIFNNIMEPWLYGSSTGISSTALILAAVFWTLIWGPVGLFLSTPLTVCLVVLGRRVPSFGFLNIILSDEKALEVHEELYQRLLKDDTDDAISIIDNYSKEHDLIALYDEVIVPTLNNIENEIKLDLIDVDKRAGLRHGIRDVIDDLSETNFENVGFKKASSKIKMMSLPARHKRDELGAIMFAHILNQLDYKVEYSFLKSENEYIGMVEKFKPNIICISIIPPATIIHTRILCKKLRLHISKSKILVGIWGYTKTKSTVVEKLKSAGADEVAVSFKEALNWIQKTYSDKIG